ncbi:MAG TPA: type II toxin-antitoxin system VapC family toxin [Gemmatimonadota bacterium]|nr:type II toxin-antitoxin system VapC family toxin [Gemmatimonadota bacterium]
MPTEKGSAILLDTHVWLWIMEGLEDPLGKVASSAIIEASRQGNLLVSVISVWEIAMLETTGRIGLSMEIAEWIQRGLSAPGLRLANLTPEIAIESTRLPDWSGGDPADRILAATARIHGAAIATRDRRILDYADRGHVSALETAGA